MHWPRNNGVHSVKAPMLVARSCRGGWQRWGSAAHPGPRQPKIQTHFQRRLKQLPENREGSYRVHCLSLNTPVPQFPRLSLLRFLRFSEINVEIMLPFCVFLLSSPFPIKVLSTPLLTWCYSASEILLNFNLSCSTKATWEPLKTSLKFLFPCLSKPLEIHIVLHAIVVNSISLNATILV